MEIQSLNWPRSTNHGSRGFFFFFFFFVKQATIQPSASLVSEPFLQMTFLGDKGSFHFTPRNFHQTRSPLLCHDCPSKSKSLDLETEESRCIPSEDPNSNPNGPMPSVAAGCQQNASADLQTKHAIYQSPSTSVSLAEDAGSRRPDPGIDDVVGFPCRKA